MIIFINSVLSEKDLKNAQTEQPLIGYAPFFDKNHLLYIAIGYNLDIISIDLVFYF